jgi:hypothetical protein
VSIYCIYIIISIQHSPLLSLDLGYANSTNIYLSKSAFDNAITPDPYLNTLHSLMDEFHPDEDINVVCSWAWGCVPTPNTTWAQVLTSTSEPVNNLTLPIMPKSPILPSVLDIVYVCPRYKAKSWGNMLMSVFVGKLAHIAQKILKSKLTDTGTKVRLPCTQRCTESLPGLARSLIESSKVPTIGKCFNSRSG